MNIYKNETAGGLENGSPEDIIRLASRFFGKKLVMMSSFGVESALLLHLVTSIIPKIPVIFIDTGYHYSQTLKFVEVLTQRFNLNLKTYQASLSPLKMEAFHGRLWRQGEEGVRLYNEIRRVEPMHRALKELKAHAVLTGAKKYQTGNEAMREFEYDNEKFYLVHPLFHLTKEEVHGYFKKYDLPYHPLVSEGFTIVGDKASAPLLLADRVSETKHGAASCACA